VSSKPGCEFGNQDRSRILIKSVSKHPTQAWILRVNMIRIDTGIFSCCACQILVHVLGISELGIAFDSYIVGGESCSFFITLTVRDIAFILYGQLKRAGLIFFINSPWFLLGRCYKSFCVRHTLLLVDLHR